jgi:hypothetical protein
MGIKATIILLVTIAVVTAVGAFSLHYNKLVKDNATLTGNVATMQITLGQSQEDLVASFKRIDEFAEALEEQARTVRRMQVVQNGANEIIKELENVFDRHDLEALLRAKPNLIIDRINRATANRLRMLECSAAGSCSNGSDNEGTDHPIVTRSPTVDVEAGNLSQ